MDEEQDILEQIADNLHTEPGEREEATKALVKNLADKCEMCGNEFGGRIPSKRYLLKHVNARFNNRTVCPSCNLSFTKNDGDFLPTIELFINSDRLLDARIPKK
ncbi:MAG: hypothetical protein KAS32_06360 [Candidatus Peribacteraceae bacterium]|nr:hypothetical protein [Candidatus Peribacteraceae bacterium]